MATDLQYMALSDLVYEDFESLIEEGSSLKDIRKSDLNKQGTKNRWPTYKEHIGDWEFLEAYKPKVLIDKEENDKKDKEKEYELTFEEKAFYAAAFQSPDQKEIIIAYRGTDGDNIIDDRDKLLGFIPIEPDFWGEMIIIKLSGVGLLIFDRGFGSA